MAGLALALLPTALGIGAQAGASRAARKTSEAGAKTQAEIEKLQREASKRQFDKRLERQKPYLEAGTEALPEFIDAVSNRGEVSDLPATRIQGDLISEFLGDQAPAFIRDRANTNLEAVETERNKGRLADLVSVGLGGAMSSAGAGVDLGTSLSRSLAQEGNIRGSALQNNAISRQNTINQTVGQLAGLPALIAANRGPGGASGPDLSRSPVFDQGAFGGTGSRFVTGGR